MIRVFLADDEIAIREGIRNSKIWTESGYQLVGEAPDGEIALSMIRDEQPDILITDIRMPFMDGIQLAEAVSRQMPWVQIIILSGYDDFNYARKAMSLGVQEYLLKPISSEELKMALDRAGERLRAGNRARPASTGGENRFLQEKLIFTLLNESTPASAEAQTVQQLRGLGIYLTAGSLIAEDISWTSGPLGDGQDILYALAQSSQGIIYACAGRHGTLAVIQGDNDRDAEERAYTFAQSAISELERIHLGPALVCVGDPVHALGQLPDSLHGARHTRHLRTAAGPLTASTVLAGRDLADPEPAAMQKDIRPLYERLSFASGGDAGEIMREYLSSMVSTDMHTTLVDSYIQVEVLLTVTRIFREAGASEAEMKRIQEYQRSLSSANPGFYTAEAVDLLDEALAYREAHMPGQGGSIARARAYLAQHFNDPNLMLRDVSEYVGMSESRFSTVFRQKMGMTFMEYLTVLRMNRAKEYLSATLMRSSQIASAVGYNDPHYFSYLFRKNTGLSPSEYRRQATGESTEPNS